MLMIISWIAFFIAAGALAMLVRDYKEEEEYYRDRGEHNETIYPLSA